jgi:hypothetical protein
MVTGEDQTPGGFVAVAQEVYGVEDRPIWEVALIREMEMPQPLATYPTLEQAEQVADAYEWIRGLKPSARMGLPSRIRDLERLKYHIPDELDPAAVAEAYELYREQEVTT